MCFFYLMVFDKAYKNSLLWNLLKIKTDPEAQFEWKLIGTEPSSLKRECKFSQWLLLL